MAAPTDIPEWASTAGRRLEPDSAELDSGFVEAQRTPARKANWIVGVLTDWVNYFRTFISSGEEFIYPVTKSRELILPLSAGVAFDNGGGSTWLLSMVSGADDYAFLDSQSDAAQLFFPLRLPHGATSVEADVIVDPGAARATSGDRFGVQITQNAVSFTTPAAPVETSHTIVRDDGTSAIQKVTCTWPNPIDNDSGMYYLRIHAGTDGGSHNGDAVIGVRVRFTDPGPRNF